MIDIPADTSKSRMSGTKIFLIVLLTMLVTAALTFWVVRAYIFPSEFRPVELSQKEEQVLEQKLGRLDSFNYSGRNSRNIPQSGSGSGSGNESDALRPEAYSEKGEERSIALTERELNGMLTKNTDLANTVAIDLADDLMSAKILVKVPQDFPIFSGNIIKVRAGMELAYRQGSPVVVLRGVSVMGVPIPSAWLGGLKNIDLVEYYGGDSGFWKAFSNGVEYIKVSNGRLNIQLKE